MLLVDRAPSLQIEQDMRQVSRSNVVIEGHERMWLQKDWMTRALKSKHSEQKHIKTS